MQSLEKCLNAGCCIPAHLPRRDTRVGMVELIYSGEELKHRTAHQDSWGLFPVLPLTHSQAICQAGLDGKDCSNQQQTVLAVTVMVSTCHQHQRVHDIFTSYFSLRLVWTDHGALLTRCSTLYPRDWVSSVYFGVISGEPVSPVQLEETCRFVPWGPMKRL